MADVLLSSDDLLVLGGPDSVEVQLDYGAKGTRGTQIFLSNGSPNVEGNILETPIINDIAINVSAADTEEYLYLYQYKYVDGVLSWHPYIKLIPNQFSANYSLSFVSGQAFLTVEIPSVALPTSGIPYTTSNFNIQATIISSNPSAIAVEVGSVISGDLYTIPLIINAAEFSSSTWSDVEGSKDVHITISVV